MIVRTLEECEKTDRRVATQTWESTRLSLKDDKMGFSFHITTIYPNSETHIHYKNHLETVYCMEGEGEVETIADGKKYKITPGTVYILDKHDDHYLRGGPNGMKVACAFNPPVSGREVHDEHGVYPADTD